MKILIPCTVVFTFFLDTADAQLCSTTDATQCVCKDSSQDCTLLPDITVSWDAMENLMSGPTEYSQTGNGSNDGRLRMTASIPNIGHGPLTVRGSNFFVCGTDTTDFDPGTCSDGSAPKQLIMQRIYHKSNDSMAYTDRWAGAMTYHPTHNHNHIDDWGVFTLRIEDPDDPNPLNWSIVGNGAKIGFCLMDHGTCTFYNGHCRDDNRYHQNGTILVNTDFPNYGLGGGNYSCSPVEQGISVGYTDIYFEHLDGMWINIPPGTCNGDYWIVADIDPLGFFIEEDKTNNWTAIPITLTKQEPSGNDVHISADKSPVLCAGDSITLTASAGTSYHWSNGETTQSITTSVAGDYTCNITNFCGSGTSNTISVTINNVPDAPAISAAADTICTGQTTTLTASGTNITWLDANGFETGTGSSFTTPSLSTSTTYYAYDEHYVAGSFHHTGKTDSSGNGDYFSNNQWLIFDVFEALTIKSMKVYANGDGIRNIMLLDQSGNIVRQGAFFVPDGASRVAVDFPVPAGINYQMRINGTANLYRDTTQVNYPYTIQSVISIHTSSSGAGDYYFFYDWEINTGAASCQSVASDYTVVVQNCVGMDEDADLSHRISVYPNPNHGNFTFRIDLPGTADLNLTVLDMMGKSIRTRHFERISGTYRESLNLSGLPKGTYFIRVDIGDKAYHLKLMIR